MSSDVTYSFDRPIPPVALQALYRQTGWAANRSVEDIERMLAGTIVALGAWQGDRLVGFARAVTDDRFRAYIEDVVIAEEFRGHGLGAEMMAVLMERLAHVEEVILSCEDHLIPFYERFGFGRVTHQFMNIWRGAV
jgi:predicted GNAT family N-acyltransferase